MTEIKKEFYESKDVEGMFVEYFYENDVLVTIRVNNIDVYNAPET